MLTCTSVRGVPRWRDRFVQYGIKVSFWGFETLKMIMFGLRIRFLPPRALVAAALVVLVACSVGLFCPRHGGAVG